jgi:hypothetical protein
VVPHSSMCIQMVLGNPNGNICNKYHHIIPFRKSCIIECNVLSILTNLPRFIIYYDNQLLWSRLNLSTLWRFPFEHGKGQEQEAINKISVHGVRFYTCNHLLIHWESVLMFEQLLIHQESALMFEQHQEDILLNIYIYIYIYSYLLSKGRILSWMVTICSIYLEHSSL